MEMSKVRNAATNESSDLEPISELDEFILTPFEEDLESLCAANEREVSAKILKISLQNPVQLSNKNFNFFEYACEQFKDDFNLILCVTSIAAIPSSSSSVERIFSSLRIAITPHSNQLSSNIVQNLLICRNNLSLVNKIKFDTFE
jgi:hAT family C-terminal dimerisation region